MAEQGPMAIAMRLRNQLQSVYKLDPLRNEEEVKLKIKDLNEHIVCYLCAGYFIDATTITECLHTFCKSCIVKYLQTSKYCPMCNIKIHETQPLLNLKLDRVMQDIVYKLVPGLQEREDKRIKEFYQSRGLERVVQPSGEDSIPDATGLPFTTFDHSKAHFYRYDEQVSLCLERQSLSLSGKKDKTKLTLQQKFVRCSVRAEVRHLRKVLCHRLNVEKHQVQMFFNNEFLPDHMTMKRLWLSHWFGKMNVVPSGLWKLLPRMNQTWRSTIVFLRTWLISFDFPMMSSKEALSLKTYRHTHDGCLPVNMASVDPYRQREVGQIKGRNHTVAPSQTDAD
ncbi:polycomb group RING finger protein 1 isoform X1 [Oncorhynchus kisutch]|nr:polycomb group RING finger protein 1 isoform X1 [Oncorhynchus kisutch]